MLHYAGAPNADPTTKATGPSGNLLLEHELHPVNPPDISGTPDQIFDLDFTRNKAPDALEWTINGIRYESPLTSTLNESKSS